MKFNDGDRVKHEIYGEGTITGHWRHEYNPHMLWHVRFDDPGIDDDILEEPTLELIPQECFWCHHGKGYHYDESIADVSQMPCNATDGEGEGRTSCLCYGWCTTKEEADTITEGMVNQIFIFPNGNVAVTDKKGQQMPGYQGSWINFDYIRKLASIAFRDNARIIGRMPDDHLGRLMNTLSEGKGSRQKRPNRLKCSNCDHIQYYHENDICMVRDCECEKFTRSENG